jgi:hypothetical protein
MTLNNSLLLLIKQHPGIDYNDLYAKLVTRYKNPASAKSALMRGLKDMASFGLIKREGTKVFITDKGLFSMSIEMKDKLVLKLNQEMKKPLDNVDNIVRLLVILSQRGVQDKDLLNNAKENASFTISDIVNLRKEIRAKRKYLKKMGELLEQQIEKMKELDFNESISMTFDDDFVESLALYCEGKKISVETKDESILSKIPTHWVKQGIISVDGENISLLIQLLLSSPWAKAVLYLPGIKLNLMAGKATLFGSHKTIDAFNFLKIEAAISESVEKNEGHFSSDNNSLLLKQ